MFPELVILDEVVPPLRGVEADPGRLQVRDDLRDFRQVLVQDFGDFVGPVFPVLAQHVGELRPQRLKYNND